MPLNSPNEPRYPRITSVLEMDERDIKGGRIDREIELGVIGKGRCNEIHKEHIGFS